MRKIIFGFIVLGLVFTLTVSFKNFALGQENENNNEVIESKNIEKFMKKHMENLMNDLEKIDKEMNKTVNVWGKQNFFSLTPSNQVMAGGVLDSVTSTGFILNSNGFKTNWIVTTNTKIVGPNKDELNLSNLQVNNPIRVKGKWNGNNFVAEIIIVFQTPAVQPHFQQVQNILIKVINMLKERGIDVTPIIQNLQQTTSTQ